MKQKMTEECLAEYYGVVEVKELPKGFELYDNASDLVFVLPMEFYLFRDRRLIDAKQFLTISGSHRQEVRILSVRDVLGIDIRVTEFQYLCGVSFERQNGVEYFYVGDVLEDVQKMNVLLVRMCWDYLQGVTNHDWYWHMQQRFGDDLIYSHMNAYDNGGKAGEWFFALRSSNIDDIEVDTGLGILIKDYTERMRRVINNADQVVTRQRRGCFNRI